MKKLYLAHGYNSWTHRDLIRAFSNEEEAGAFMEGLTDPHLQVIAYQSSSQLVNILLANQGLKNYD
jgi:hypothetical protein